MHLFDPSLSWPSNLLATPIPDMLLIRSQSFDLLQCPWKKEEDWSSQWSHYVAPEEASEFLHMIFFDSEAASNSETTSLSEFLTSFRSDGSQVCRYRCLSVPRWGANVFDGMSLLDLIHARINGDSTCSSVSNGRYREFVHEFQQRLDQSLHS